MAKAKCCSFNWPECVELRAQLGLKAIDISVMYSGPKP